MKICYRFGRDKKIARWIFNETGSSLEGKKIKVARRPTKFNWKSEILHSSTTFIKFVLSSLEWWIAIGALVASITWQFIGCRLSPVRKNANKFPLIPKLWTIFVRNYSRRATLALFLSFFCRLSSRRKLCFQTLHFAITECTWTVIIFYLTVGNTSVYWESINRPTCDFRSNDRAWRNPIRDSER